MAVPDGFVAFRKFLLWCFNVSYSEPTHPLWYVRLSWFSGQSVKNVGFLQSVKGHHPGNQVHLTQVFGFGQVSCQSPHLVSTQTKTLHSLISLFKPELGFILSWFYFHCRNVCLWNEPSKWNTVRDNRKEEKVPNYMNVWPLGASICVYLMWFLLEFLWSLYWSGQKQWKDPNSAEAMKKNLKTHRLNVISVHVRHIRNTSNVWTFSVTVVSAPGNFIMVTDRESKLWFR